MNPSPEEARGHWAGAAQIVRYNWPRYAAALALAGGAGWLLATRTGPRWLRAGALPAAALSLWWSAASFAASHWIYDRSELYRWTWIPGALPRPPRRWLNLHAGLDESSPALRRLFPAAAGTTADFHSPEEMPEPGIARARAGQPAGGAPGSEAVDWRRLPYADGAFDTLFLLFAAHELRRPASREGFFRELRRVLAPGGQLLLVEHARDAANFAVFGPGFTHFLAADEWRRLAALAGFDLARENRMTPFVRVFQLRRPE